MTSPDAGCGRAGGVARGMAAGLGRVKGGQCERPVFVGREEQSPGLLEGSS